MRRSLLLLCATLVVSTVPVGAKVQSPMTTLDALRDRNRVLLVFSNGDNALSEAQLDVAARHAQEFRERDLVLVGLSGTDASVPALLLAPGGDKAARNRFHVTTGEFTVILIGKDGGEKLRSHQPMPW